MQPNDFSAGIINQLTDYFSERVRDFTIINQNTDHVVDVCIRFVMYDYCLVKVSVERARVGFGVSADRFGASLARTELLSTYSGAGTDFVEKSVLAELDKQIRLRIPDKFLAAKGWESSVES